MKHTHHQKKFNSSLGRAGKLASKSCSVGAACNSFVRAAHKEQQLPPAERERENAKPKSETGMGYASIYAYFTYRHRSRAVEIAAGECWPCPSADFARCCRNQSAPCSASAGTAAPRRWDSSCPTGCCGCPPAAARASPAPCSACSCSRKARLEKM